MSGISGDGSTIAGYGTICTTFAANGSCVSSGEVHAFRWTPSGGYQVLGSPGGTDFFGSGAVSYDGSVIVGEHPLPNQYAAFRWTVATGMVDLGTLGGAESGAFASSQDGSVIVGSSLTSQSTGSSTVFCWTAKTGMQDVTTLVNAPQRLILQSALGISANGTVITGNGYNAKPGIDGARRTGLPLP